MRKLMKVRLKAFPAVLLVSYFFILTLPAHAIVVKFDNPRNIEEAISFGAANYRSIEKLLDARYAFGSTKDFGEGGVLHTKWYKLALMSAKKTEEGATLSRQEQADIFSDPCLQINIKVYGRSLDFAKDYQVTLLQGNNVIKPEKIHADSFIADASAKKSMPGFPGYWAIVRSYFRYDSFNPVSPTTLILKKDGKESRFSIYFEYYK
jgi:hypothetical protein